MKSLDILNKEYVKTGTIASLTIELTTWCNWRCEHCFIDDFSISGMSLEKLKKIIWQFKEMGGREVVFTGGEILTRSDFFEIIEYARGMFLEVGLFTNISLLTRSKIRKLADLYVSFVSCTVFSLDEEIHDSITKRKGSLRAVLANLEELRDFGIPIIVKTPLMEKNAECYAQIRSFCEKEGFAFKVDTQIIAKRDKNTDPLDFSLSKERLKLHQGEVDKINNVGYLAERSRESLVCETMKLSLFISAEGDVYPCSLFPEVLGNVFNDSLMEIWNSDTRRHLSDYTFIDSIKCGNCELFEFCIPCPGLAYQEHGNRKSCSSICQKIAVSRKDMR